MAPKPKRDTRTREELVREIEFWKRGGWAEQVAPTLRVLFFCIAFLGGAYFIKETFVGVAREYAGKDTKANVIYSLVSEMSISMVASWTFGLGGVGFGLRERKLRKKTVERLSKRIADLEGTIDPARTSSQLTSRGDTNPEDL